MFFRPRTVAVFLPLWVMLLFRASSFHLVFALDRLAFHSLNFNNVVVGQSGTQTLQLANSGTAPVQITAMSVSNPSFAFTGPSVPGSRPPSGSLSDTLTFTPTASGSSTATLNIASNASNVYRSEVSSGSFSPLFGTAIPQGAYDDDTVSAGNTCYYVVNAVDAAGVQSLHSNQATAVIP